MVDSLRAHHRYELVRIVLGQALILGTGCLESLQILVLREGIEFLEPLEFLQRAGLKHDITLVINDGVELLGGHSEDVADLVGQGTEVPDMSHGHHQTDVTATFTTYFLLGYLDTASFADTALVTDTLVFAAVALIVLDRTEDTLAEQTVAFGLVGTVVDRLGFENLTIGVVENLVGRCQSDADAREIGLCICIFTKSHFF